MSQKSKFKPIHILLYVVMISLTIGIYLFKDKIIPDINEPYKEQYATYEMVEADVISIRYETSGRRKSSRLHITVQFTDKDEKIHVVELDDNSYQGIKEGDKIIIYYDPENPNRAETEMHYKEVMEQ